jgi:hypothetical protein
VIPLLVGVVGADEPFFVEGVLESRRCVDSVGSPVAGVDNGTGSHAPTVGRAGRILRIDARAGQGIHGLQRFDPAILGEVVVVQTKSGAEHRFRALPGSVGDADSWGESFVIIVRSALRERCCRNVQRLKSLENWIGELAAV